MIIRPATENDISSCEVLVREPGFAFANGKYPDRTYFVRYLEDPYFLVVEESGSVIGFLVSEPMKGDGTILWYLVIDKKFRGKGYGSQLLEEFEKRIKKLGRRFLLLHAVPDNPDTLEFYKTHGFLKGETQIEHLKYL